MFSESSSMYTTCCSVSTLYSDRDQPNFLWMLYGVQRQEGLFDQGYMSSIVNRATHRTGNLRADFILPEHWPKQPFQSRPMHHLHVLWWERPRSEHVLSSHGPCRPRPQLVCLCERFIETSLMILVLYARETVASISAVTRKNTEFSGCSVTSVTSRLQPQRHPSHQWSALPMVLKRLIQKLKKNMVRSIVIWTVAQN